MDSSTGNFIDVPGRTIPGLADDSSPATIQVCKGFAPDPYRVAVFLAAVDAWWESRIIPIGEQA